MQSESGGCLQKQDEKGSFFLVTMNVDHEEMRDEDNRNRVIIPATLCGNNGSGSGGPLLAGLRPSSVYSSNVWRKYPSKK